MLILLNHVKIVVNITKLNGKSVVEM